MTIEVASDLLREAVRTSLTVSAPILLGAVSLGLLISVLQAATQVNEQTLTFVPKIVLVLVLFAVLFPWIMGTMVDFGLRLFDQAARVGGT